MMWNIAENSFLKYVYLS